MKTRLFIFVSIGFMVLESSYCAEPVFYSIEPGFAINDFSFSEDGSQIITANSGTKMPSNTGISGSQGGINFWDATSGIYLDSIDQDPFGETVYYVPRSFDVSANGEKLIVGTIFDYVHLWDLTTKSFLQRFGPHPYDWNNSSFRSIPYVKLSTDGEWFLTASFGAKDQIHLWKSNEEEVIKIFDSTISAFDFSPNMKYIINGNLVYDFNTYDVVHVLNSGFRDEQNAWQMQNITNPGDKIAISKDSKYLFTSEYATLLDTDHKYQILKWDLEEGKLLDVISTHPENVLDIDITLNGQLLAVYTQRHSVDYDISLWDISTKARLATINSGDYNNPNVVFSPDGKQMLTGGPNWSVRVWDVEKLLSQSTADQFEEYN
ncbi:hypothetical protein K8I31_17340 [bacterium]|nr:hypothetical protein [bacterium]